MTTTTTREQALTEVDHMMMEAIAYCRLHNVQVSVCYEVAGGDARMAFNANPGFLMSHVHSITRSAGISVPMVSLPLGRRIALGFALFWRTVFSAKQLPK